MSPYSPISSFANLWWWVCAKCIGFGMGNLINLTARCFYWNVFFKSSSLDPSADRSLFSRGLQRWFGTQSGYSIDFIFGVLCEWQSAYSNSRFSRFEFHYLGLQCRKWLLIPPIHSSSHGVCCACTALPRQRQCLQALLTIFAPRGGRLTSSCL